METYLHKTTGERFWAITIIPSLFITYNKDSFIENNKNILVISTSFLIWDLGIKITI